MYKEELTEEGIVRESKDGIATVAISNSDYCEDCSAKIYCKPGNTKERILTVKDPFGTNKGDNVKISVRGSKILTASLWLYGMPLLLLIVSLIAGMQVFKTNKEINSTLVFLGIVLLYAVIAALVGKRKKNNLKYYPEITFVSSHTPNN